MKRDVEVSIGGIENREQTERRSPWAVAMHRKVRNLVRKAGMARIIVKKAGKTYSVVFGHHVLEAARECGHSHVRADVITCTEAGKVSLEESLLAFQSGLEEMYLAASVRGREALHQPISDLSAAARPQRPRGTLR